jgi:signal transduction histidine kinase
VLSDGLLSLEITDDGTGLASADLLKPGSFGLRGLGERARAAGGWLDVLPSVSGTTVMLTVPADVGLEAGVATAADAEREDDA